MPQCIGLQSFKSEVKCSRENWAINVQYSWYATIWGQLPFMTVAHTSLRWNSTLSQGLISRAESLLRIIRGWKACCLLNWRSSVCGMALSILVRPFFLWLLTIGYSSFSLPGVELRIEEAYAVFFLCQSSFKFLQKKPNDITPWLQYYPKLSYFELYCIHVYI